MLTKHNEKKYEQAGEKHIRLHLLNVDEIRSIQDSNTIDDNLQSQKMLQNLTRRVNLIKNVQEVQ